MQQSLSESLAIVTQWRLSQAASAHPGPAADPQIMDKPGGQDADPSSTVAAKFDLETPPGSAKAADAAAHTHFRDEGPFTKDIDNLATISLDTPFQEQPAEHGLSQHAAGPEVLPGAAASIGLPLSSSLSSFRGSEQVSEAVVLVGSTTSGAVAPAEAPASHNQPLPEPQPPRAFPVKVGGQAAGHDNTLATRNSKPAVTSGPCSH